eukprot:TRINITY_DN22275_c1_g3_i2.p1 TRINITY_DN22275_c1_g3~~TRINITY_DN22275_c1_g3_i2.p1  ORF type:complete len:689 (-),score=137.54 TRINITY_DN22275_c1_g3_i2:525-2591(-)
MTAHYGFAGRFKAEVKSPVAAWSFWEDAFVAYHRQALASLLQHGLRAAPVDVDPCGWLLRYQLVAAAGMRWPAHTLLHAALELEVGRTRPQAEGCRAPRLAEARQYLLPSLIDLVRPCQGLARDGIGLLSFLPYWAISYGQQRSAQPRRKGKVNYATAPFVCSRDQWIPPTADGRHDEILRSQFWRAFLSLPQPRYSPMAWQGSPLGPFVPLWAAAQTSEADLAAVRARWAECMRPEKVEEAMTQSDGELRGERGKKKVAGHGWLHERQVRLQGLPLAEGKILYAFLGSGKKGAGFLNPKSPLHWLLDLPGEALGAAGGGGGFWELWISSVTWQRSLDLRDDAKFLSNPRFFHLFLPNSTIQEAKLAGYIAVTELQLASGFRFHYIVFCDDDMWLQFSSSASTTGDGNIANASMTRGVTSAYAFFHQQLLKDGPAIAAIGKGKKDFNIFTAPSTKGRSLCQSSKRPCVRHWDDCFHAYHGSAFPFFSVDLMFDTVNWHLAGISSTYLRTALFGGRAVYYTELQAMSHGEQRGEYLNLHVKKNGLPGPALSNIRLFLPMAHRMARALPPGLAQRVHYELFSPHEAAEFTESCLDTSLADFAALWRERKDAACPEEGTFEASLMAQRSGIPRLKYVAHMEGFLTAWAGDLEAFAILGDVRNASSVYSMPPAVGTLPHGPARKTGGPRLYV